MDPKYDPWRRQLVRERGSYAALEFWAKCLYERLHRIADDEGRIHLGGRDPVVAIALRGGGAGPGDRRLIRKLLPVLRREGSVWLEGDTLVLRDFNALERVAPQTSDAPETGLGQASDERAAGTSRAQHGRATSTRPTRDERVTGARSELTTEYDAYENRSTRAVSLPSLILSPDPPKAPHRATYVDPHPEGARGPEHYKPGKGRFGR